MAEYTPNQPPTGVSPLLELAAYLQKARDRENVTSLPANSLQAVQRNLRNKSRHNAGDVEAIIAAIDSNDTGLCRRLDPRAIITLCAIFIHSEECLAQQRGFCILMESLHEDRSNPSTESYSKKVQLGAKALILLIKVFVTEKVSYQTRRWMGVLALELLKHCPENVRTLQHDSERSWGHLTKIIKHEQCQILKLLAGSMIREMLWDGVRPEDFWSTERDRILFLDFPRGQFQDTQWVTTFEAFVDNLVLSKILSQEVASVVFAHAVFLQNIAYHIAEESAIVVTLGRELNIVFPASANLPARFIDVPLGNILGVSFGQLETQSQTRTYGLVIQLSNQGGNTFIVNATGRSNTQVGLAFESEAVAVSLKKAIESKSVGEKDLITSRSEAVDFSALQSNDDPVGYGVRLTNAKDSTVNDSNAKALASKRSRIDTVTSATIDLKRASRRSATHLYETCANGNNNIPNVQIAHTSVAISPIDDSPTGVLRPANANTEKNLDEASPVELTNSVQRGESAVASSKAIRLFVPETPQASRSKNDRIVLQDSDEEYESHDDLYTATPKKAQEKPSGRNSVTHEGQPEMEEAQVKRNEKGQFKVKSSRTAITDSRPNYQLRKRLRKRDGQIVPRNSAAARNEVSDREECGLGERSENSIASTKPASISKKTRAGTKKLTEEMRTSRISKSKKKTQMNVKNHDTEEPELEHPCTHSKSRREPQTATRASAARLSPAQAAVRNPGDSKSATTSKHGTSDLPSVNGNRVNQASNVQVKDHGLPGITSKDHDEEIIWDINLTLTDDDNKHAPQRGKRGNVAKQQSKVSKVQKPKKSGMREPAGRASKAKPAEPVTRHLVTTESTYPKSRRAAALNAKKKIRELEEVGDITDEVLSASETQPKFTAANVKMSNSKVVPLASVAQEKALNVREDRTPKVDAFEDSHTTTNKQPKAGPMPDLANNATSNNNAKNSRSPATELQKIHKERPHGVPIIGDLPTQTLQNAREAVTKSPPLAKVPEQTNRVSPNQATKPLNEPTNSITHNMGSFRSMLPSRWQKFTENDSNRQTSNDKSTHQDIIVGPPELPDANGILQGAEDRHFEDALPYTDEASTDTRDGGEDINCEAVATTNRARSKPAVPNARIELASAKTASHVPDPFRARLNNLVPGIKDPGVLAKTSDNPGSIVTREVKHTRLDNDGYNVVREVEQIKKAQSPLLAQEVVAKRKPPTTKSEHAKKRVQDPNVGRELKAETMKSLERIQNRAQSTPRNNVEAVLGVRAEDARERIPPINPPRKSLLISFDDSGPSNQSTISVKRQHIGQNLWIVSPQSKKPQANHTHKRKLADYMDDRQPWEPKQLVKRPKQPLISPDMQTAVSEASKKPNIHIFQERPPRLSSQSTRVAENGSPLPFIQSRKDPSRAWKESMEDEGGVDVPSMNRTDNDGECHQDQDEEPVEGQYHASSKQNASLPNDTKVNFVSSLNNNKHQTSSPQAPSALSAMPPHHINRSGDIVNSKTNEAIVPMNPQDPFIGPSLNPPSSFVERLRKTSDLEAQYQIEKAKERESTANIKRSFMSEEDPDKTLVEHNPTKKRRRVLEEISDSSSNSQQSSTKEGPPSEQTPDEEESNDEGNEQWRKALEPHQDNMLDVLSCISHRIVRHLVDNETAVNDMIKDFEKGGKRLIDLYKKERQKDIDSKRMEIEQSRRQIADMFTSAQLELEKLSEAVARRPSVGDLQKEYQAKQQSLRSCVDEARAACK